MDGLYLTTRNTCMQKPLALLAKPLYDEGFKVVVMVIR
jgi:hypothetical protein